MDTNLLAELMKTRQHRGIRAAQALRGEMSVKAGDTSAIETQPSLDQRTNRYQPCSGCGKLAKHGLCKACKERAYQPANCPGS